MLAGKRDLRATDRFSPFVCLEVDVEKVGKGFLIHTKNYPAIKLWKLQVVSEIRTPGTLRERILIQHDCDISFSNANNNFTNMPLLITLSWSMEPKAFIDFYHYKKRPFSFPHNTCANNLTWDTEMMMIIRDSEKEQGGRVCSAHPDVKGPSEVVQVGLDEADVLQAQLGAPTLSPEQRLFLVLDEDDLRVKDRRNEDITGGNVATFQNTDVRFNGKRDEEDAKH